MACISKIKHYMAHDKNTKDWSELRHRKTCRRLTVKIHQSFSHEYFTLQLLLSETPVLGLLRTSLPYIRMLEVLLQNQCTSTYAGLSPPEPPQNVLRPCASDFHVDLN